MLGLNASGLPLDIHPSQPPAADLAVFIGGHGVGLVFVPFFIGRRMPYGRARGAPCGHRGAGGGAQLSKHGNS